MEDSPARAVATAHARLARARERLRARDLEIVRSQVELSQIPAPTGAEGRRGLEVARRFRAAHLSDVRTDDAGNVVGVRTGSDPTLAPVVVCAHMDTVFPDDTPLMVRRENGVLLGPGICDNSRGLAVMLALAEEVDGVRIRTARPVVFAATVGEEGSGDLRGARALFAASGAGVGASAAIALDGAGDERVVHRALGSRRFRVTFQGPGGHSWAAYGAPNPLHAAAAMATALASLPLPATPRTTLSVTRMGGGMSVNSIPEEGWLEVDLRSTSAAVLARYSAEVAAAAREAARGEDARRAARSPALIVSVAAMGDRPCGEVPLDGPLVRAAFEATRIVGRRPSGGAASTDASIPIGLGIPAVAIGAGGRGGGAHTTGEWYENRHGTLGVVRALTLIATAAGLRTAG